MSQKNEPGRWLHDVVCDMEDTGIAYDWNMMRDGSRIMFQS